MKESGGRKQGAPSPCAACKLLRRKCAQDCVFAPYFPADEPQKFANVHKVFGASNVNKMLQVSILPLILLTSTDQVFFSSHQHTWESLGSPSLLRGKYDFFIIA